MVWLPRRAHRRDAQTRDDRAVPCQRLPRPDPDARARRAPGDRLAGGLPTDGGGEARPPTRMTVAAVGAGLAGVRTCEALRARGYVDTIVLVGEERHSPYSRPPLSKEVLRGEKDESVATLRTADELASLDVDVRLGVTATALRPQDRQIDLHDGAAIDYADVVVATGAQPRTLPGVRLDGVHVLRTLDDCLALRDALVERTRVVVVGAGFIGLEVAASARSRGAHVKVVDMLPAPLARVLDPAIGEAVR